MKVNVAQAPPPPSSTSSSTICHHSSQTTLPSLHLSRSFSSSLSLSSTKSTAHNHLRRSCSASFNGHDFPHHQNDHFTPHPKTTPLFGHVDVLEPAFLGIRPDPPEWPAREAVIRECIARRANCVDIPLSLRMIAMKQKFLKLEINDLGSDELGNKKNPMNSLCCSTLFIIKEIQNCALKNRGIILDEEVDDVIVGKFQREMISSFVWLFKEVFAKTPDLMVQIMVFTSTFALHSLQSSSLGGDFYGGNLVKSEMACVEVANSGVPVRGVLEKSEGVRGGGDEVRSQGVRFVDDDDVGGVIVDGGDYETKKMKKFEFVSPVTVEIERDDYEEYHRTELFYQIGLLQEPDNTLLLSNYAQFLCLVSRDYDRAEECFKRAIQLDGSDAEVASLYANFLWVFRNDLWGAEERFQQAVAAEPDNSYHASKYASFLWSTGGDETCYPIDPPRSKN